MAFTEKLHLARESGIAPDIIITGAKPHPIKNYFLAAFFASRIRSLRRSARR